MQAFNANAVACRLLSSCLMTVTSTATCRRGCVQAAVKMPDDSDRYSNMPARLQEKLMGFQREGIKFALKRGGRLLVGDEMGLGKTVQAIGIMACYKDEWPCVIITPSSLRGAAWPQPTWIGQFANANAVSSNNYFY